MPTKEQVSIWNKKAKEKLPKEYVPWCSMRQRCSNQNLRTYERYGAKGITVCPEWDSFKQFLADMGPRPSMNHTIDRIDNDKGYSKANCRWATSLEQSWNRSNTVMLEFSGKTMSMRSWAKEVGLKYTTLTRRLRTYGWSVERALTEGVHFVRIN